MLFNMIHTLIIHKIIISKIKIYMYMFLIMWHLMSETYE